MLHEPMTAQPTLSAERFQLRPLRASDAGLIATYTADRLLAEGTRAIPHPLPPGATEAYIDRALGDHRTEDVWAIDGAARGLPAVLGVVSLSAMDRGQSEIKYWVAPAFWNAGYASEAVAAVVAANPHGARTLFAEVFQDNPGSARVLSNCGFDFLGDAEAFSVARGVIVPTWTYVKRMA